MTSSLTSILQSLRLLPGNESLRQPTSLHKTFPLQNINGELPSGLNEITLSEVAFHDSYDDCWIVIYDRVYDVTRFLHSHPGGLDVIMDHAGRDATLAFHGTGHSSDAIDQMQDFIIGELPAKERIFRTANSKVLLKGIPE